MSTGVDSTLDLAFGADQSGSATIVVRATDSGALTVDDTLVVTVNPVNDTPVVASAMPDTTVNEDNATITAYRDLNSVFDTEAKPARTGQFHLHDSADSPSPPCPLIG